MRAFATLVLLLFLTACGTPTIPSEVTRFHALPSADSGTFTIVSTPPQRGSLEFQSYAELVADEFVRRGFQPVAPGQGQAPNYEVDLAWGVGNGVSEFHSSPTTFYGGASTFGSRSGFGIGMGIPWGGWPHGGYNIDSRTLFPKWLRVTMRPGNAPEGANVFEGRAQILSEARSIQPVMPYLVEALFTDFPGLSGRTQRVEVPVRR